MRGTFYGIGVGPGDPELLTVKAIKAIEAADVLIAPKTEKKDGSVALEIARPHLKKDIEIVYQVFPMVKDFAEDTGAWEANKAEILALLHAGKNVAFLTLAAIGSQIGRPIVEGNDVLAIIPATADKERLEEIMAVAGSAVIMKVYHNSAEIIDLLRRNHMAKDAVLVSRAGLDGERIIYDLEAHADEKLNYLSTILTRRS